MNQLSLYSTSSSAERKQEKTRFPTWIKVGAIAFASAAIGGLAAAWFYRGTLQKLQAGQLSQENSNFGREIPSDDDGF